MIYQQKKTLHIAAGFILICIILLIVSAFIKVPYRISTYAEVFPKEKWLLTRGNGGQIISNLIDYTEGYTAHYSISQVERGEFVSADFGAYIQGKNKFEKGDTIVVLHSSNVTDQFVTALGEWDVALANLKSQSSGEKEPLIKEAESRLKYIEEQISEQQIIFNRIKQLYEKNLASEQEYELEKLNLNLLEIDAKICNAQIENLKTGVKPEEVKFLGSQVGALESRLKFLKERESQLLYVSPIEGNTISSFSPDTLLHVTNYEQVVLHVPIKIYDLPEFKDKRMIEVSISSLQETYSVKVLSINKEVKLINDQQVVFVVLLLNNSGENLLPGMIVENSLKLNEITLFEQLSRLITR